MSNLAEMPSIDNYRHTVIKKWQVKNRGSAKSYVHVASLRDHNSNYYWDLRNFFYFCKDAKCLKCAMLF